MQINDDKLRRHYERAISLVPTLPRELLPIFGLMDAYSWFKTIEGAESICLKEIMEHLSSQELRAPLKAWYLRHDYLNPAADDFRRNLEQTINDKLPLGKK